MIKRILQIIGILLSGVLIALVIVALVVEQVEYTTMVNVDASVEAAWATFMDEDRLPEWLAGLTEVEQQSGDSEGVGSSFRLHFGEGVYVDETVTEIVPHERYSFDMETELFTGHTTVNFDKVGDQLRVSQDVAMRGSSFLWRALLPIMKPIMVSEQSAALESLRTLIETSPSMIKPEPSTNVVPPDTTAASDMPPAPALKHPDHEPEVFLR